MSHRILNVPKDSNEINEFIEVFKLHSEKEAYIRHTLAHIKEKWGGVPAFGDGFIDASMTITKDGKLVFPYRHIASHKLNQYLKEKVGDFSLYSRLYESNLRSYNIDITYNLGSLKDEYWSDLRMSLDDNLNVTHAALTFDSNENDERRLEY